MKLKKFQVIGFRSVKDSGWIDADDVTALIGTNESGKTNLLVPLWKLNPAKEGQINPIQDYPRKRYHEIKALEKKPIFIKAVFEVPQNLAEAISKLTGCDVSEVTEVQVSKDFAGNRFISFPKETGPKTMPATEFTVVISEAITSINALTFVEADAPLREKAIQNLNRTHQKVQSYGETINLAAFEKILAEASVIDEEAPNSVVKPAYNNFRTNLEGKKTNLTKNSPGKNKDVENLIYEHIPHFIYYANYGNLDGEIYLPRVIEDMKRSDLGPKAEAKARTLRVLFEFVKLEPKEILELGKDPVPPQGQTLTNEQIEAAQERKRERTILLNSAAADITERFKRWWKQGEYQFDFRADGDYFRIDVSDDRRPEKIELESRSTGLQWFFSFYLVFLVESSGEHEHSILLLDEPGLTLHPIAQEDLSKFFDNLSKGNQLIYTTHSPFMVDSNHLDRVKAVYVDGNGDTAVSPDLRITEEKTQGKSIYPVYAALNLSASRSLLLGSKLVIVEGESDQYYLSTIKLILISKGQITPLREFAFIPAGGVRGVKPIVSILAGRDEDLPLVFLDSDSAGVDFALKLKSGVYKGQENRIENCETFTNLVQSEIEDLMPWNTMLDAMDRFFRAPDERFHDFAKQGQAIIPQAEAFAKKHGIPLYLGWKVDVAKNVKSRLLSAPNAADDSILPIWKKLFEWLEQ